MELKDYTTEELKAELRRRTDLAKAEKAMEKTDYEKAYEWYRHNYKSLPIEEMKRITDLFTRLSEIRSLMIMQCEILTKLQIRHEELTYKAIEWYYENNSDSNEQSV